MPSLKDRFTHWLEDVRERHPFLDHVVATVSHYGATNGNGQAGAVTYFGFLSFFPILALAFFLVGIIAQVYPEARSDLVTAIEKVLPGMIGSGDGQVPLRLFEENAGRVGVVGLAGVLYSGLGWLSGMRNAFEVLFVLPRREQPGFLVGKALDLLTLAVLGVVLLVSVALSGAVAGFSTQILQWLGFPPDSLPAESVVWVVGHGLAIVATTLLLMAMFRLLADPEEPRAALFQGALLGAVGFELLKMLAGFLISHTQDQPAFRAFGVALILVVWINYFSRLVMLAAAWAYTSPDAVQQRAHAAIIAPGAFLAAASETPASTPGPAAERREQRSTGLLLAGAAAVGATLALAVRRLWSGER